MPFTSQQRKELLHYLLLVREFEERVGEAFLRGETAGTMLHLSIGEEAMAVGVVRMMKEGDWMTAPHRGHGMFVARGADLGRMFAEVCGKATGYCKGKGGSMHIADIELGHLGANAIVGGGISIATGAALSSVLLKEPRVAVAFFGDGAMQQGVLYESMNLAALWNLPVVYVCVNNQYGMGTRIDRASKRLDFEERARQFGLTAYRVDGADVEAVAEKAQILIENARQGKGPGFLIGDCYRFYGHARRDPSPYRDPKEEELGRQKDPIRIMEQRLLSEGVITAEELEAMRQEVRALMDAAVEFSRNSPEPPLESITQDVYAEAPEGSVV